jgi:hypothetical protein
VEILQELDRLRARVAEIRGERLSIAARGFVAAVDDLPPLLVALGRVEILEAAQLVSTDSWGSSCEASRCVGGARGSFLLGGRRTHA